MQKPSSARNPVNPPKHCQVISTRCPCVKLSHSSKGYSEPFLIDTHTYPDGDLQPFNEKVGAEMSPGSHPIFGTRGNLQRSQFSSPLQRIIHTWELDPSPSLFATPISLFISISLTICLRISYLYKMNQNRTSFFDSITSSFLNSTAKFLEFPLLVFSHSPATLSSDHPVRLWVASAEVRPALSARELSLAPSLCHKTLPTSPVGLSLFYSFFCAQPLSVRYIRAPSWAIFSLSSLPGKSCPAHSSNTVSRLLTIKTLTCLSNCLLDLSTANIIIISNRTVHTKILILL